MENKYLIYKISGGLNHMMNMINNSIIFSKKTNRKLIIDTNSGAFKNNFNKYFYITNINYETNFDSLINDKSIDFYLYEKYVKESVKYVYGDYKLCDISVCLTENEILNNTDKIIFFSFIKQELTGEQLYNEKEWNIKVSKPIVEDIKELPKISDEYIGIHYRNTDMKTDFNYILTELKKYIKKYNKIYFATDDFSSVNNLRKHISSNIEIIQYTTPFDSKGKSIHYNNPNKDEVIFNALVDMYFLQKSTIFIPSPTSSFSRRIMYFRKNDVFFN